MYVVTTYMCVHTFKRGFTLGHPLLGSPEFQVFFSSRSREVKLHRSSSREGVGCSPYVSMYVCTPEYGMNIGSLFVFNSTEGTPRRPFSRAFLWFWFHRARATDSGTGAPVRLGGTLLPPKHDLCVRIDPPTTITLRGVHHQPRNTPGSLERNTSCTLLLRRYR